MAVSANTLFHFTKLRSLEQILISKGIWPQYSLERFQTALPQNSKYKTAYIPMVCFCDLKLTQLSDKSISKHTMHFGCYGIGFKKEWGIKQRISPVLYIHKNSIASETIVKIIEEINTTNIGSIDQLANSLGEIVKFLKPYEGYWQKDKRRGTLISYYDEREWRYIPKESKFTVFPKSDTRSSILKSLNTELQSRALNFEPDDIKYIIVDKKIEKKVIAKAINKMKISYPQKTELITKIITLDEIKEDF